MRDVSKLKFIGESFCSQYQSQAKFYIDEAHTSGLRHLVVVYENGDADFLAGIPDEWADENVQDFIFWPMKNPNSPYPAWEVPARAYGSPTLYAWWKGGAPRLRSRADSPVVLLQSCGGIQSPASEREISVDCMGHKDGDAKHT